MFKILSPGSPRFQEIEFCLLLGWALLYPAKIGYSYYLGFMCLLAVFMLAKVSLLKSIVLDRFSLFLLALNSLFIFSAFFSPHPIKSLLFAADVFMVSLWITFFYLEKEDMGRYLRLAAYCDLAFLAGGDCRFRRAGRAAAGCRGIQESHPAGDRLGAGGPDFPSLPAEEI